MSFSGIVVRRDWWARHMRDMHRRDLICRDTCSIGPGSRSALAMAVLLVVGVLVAAKMMNMGGSGAGGLFQSIDSLGQSSQVSALQQERQMIIAMNDAAETLTAAAKPAMADPTRILAAQQSAGGSGIQTGTAITGYAAGRPKRGHGDRRGGTRRLRVQQGDPVDLPVRPVAARERLERVRPEPVRRLRHPAIGARKQDGHVRVGLPDRPDHPRSSGGCGTSNRSTARPVPHGRTKWKYIPTNPARRRIC